MAISNAKHQICETTIFIVHNLYAVEIWFGDELDDIEDLIFISCDSFRSSFDFMDFYS